MVSHARRWSLFLALVALAVLVPFALFGSALETWSLARLSAPAPPPLIAGLAVGLLTVDVVLPLPSSLVAIGAGHALGFAPGALAVWVGLTLSCVLGCALGRWLGAPGVRRLVGADEVARTAARLRAPRGLLLLAASRAIPVASEVTVVVAGAVRLPWPWFLTVTGLANAGLAVVYAAVGALSAELGHGVLAVLAGIVLPGLALVAMPALVRRLAAPRAVTSPRRARTTRTAARACGSTSSSACSSQAIPPAVLAMSSQPEPMGRSHHSDSEPSPPAISIRLPAGRPKSPPG
jgi:uncharacterized membrane protein YdjX (TVP38/TMEM64 family)